VLTRHPSRQRERARLPSQAITTAGRARVIAFAAEQ
jgi:hypothetical protein